MEVLRPKVLVVFVDTARPYSVYFSQSQYTLGSRFCYKGNKRDFHTFEPPELRRTHTSRDIQTRCTAWPCRSVSCRRVARLLPLRGPLATCRTRPVNDDEVIARAMHGVQAQEGGPCSPCQAVTSCILLRPGPSWNRRTFNAACPALIRCQGVRMPPRRRQRDRLVTTTSTNTRIRHSVKGKHGKLKGVEVSDD